MNKSLVDKMKRKLMYNRTKRKLMYNSKKLKEFDADTLLKMKSNRKGFFSREFL